MNCEDVIKYLEVLSPPTYAYEWDNVGLLVGSMAQPVKKVMIALDATDGIIDQAILENVDLLITHHPLIFQSVKRIVDTDMVGNRLLKLAKNEICYYAMHTNFDVMGMADAAADQLQLEGPQVLAVTYEDDISEEGIGRVGELPMEMCLSQVAELVKEAFLIDKVLVYGDAENLVKRVAISPGSGKSMIKDALIKGAQVLITGDIDYHSGIDAMAQGLAIIDAGHYGVEKIFCPYMEQFIRNNIRELEVIVAEDRNPFFVV